MSTSSPVHLGAERGWFIDPPPNSPYPCPVVHFLARAAHILLLCGEISQASLTLGGRQFNGLLDGSEQFVQIDWLVQIGVGA